MMGCLSPLVRTIAMNEMKRPEEEVLSVYISDLIKEVAPRRPKIEIDSHSALGYGGYGLDLLEYLTVLSRVNAVFGSFVGKGSTWPHCVQELVKCIRD